MGTNYYMEVGGKKEGICECCGQKIIETETIHIGKVSMGWTFALHITDELPDLYTWYKYLEETIPVIKDEYGEILDLQKLMHVITERRNDQKWEDKLWTGYNNEEAFHEFNGSERGPHNFLRRTGNDGFPRGDIPCDYLRGEFS